MAPTNEMRVYTQPYEPLKNDVTQGNVGLVQILDAGGNVLLSLTHKDAAVIGGDMLRVAQDAAAEQGKYDAAWQVRYCIELGIDDPTLVGAGPVRMRVAEGAFETSIAAVAAAFEAKGSTAASLWDDAGTWCDAYEGSWERAEHATIVGASIVQFTDAEGTDEDSRIDLY